MSISTRFLGLLINRFSPKNRLGDNFVSFCRFVFAHKRMPKASRLYFNDVIYRMKVSGELEDPLRVFVSDKEFFKLYVSSKVGEEYVVPTLAVLRNDKEVDGFVFPKSFCAKPTHSSGQVKIVKDYSGDEALKAELKSWLEFDHYARSRERNYKNLKKKVIVEPVIFGESDLVDYRFFCFNGKVKLICLDVGKYSSYQRAFYTIDWERLDFSLAYPLFEGDLEKPERLNDMILVAQRLSEDFDFVRVDFYSSGDRFYVGEITNGHASGNQSFIPAKAEEFASEILFGKFVQ